MEVTMLLCDSAQEVNGKLYILGGGWSRLTLRQPAFISLALKLGVPWDQANVRHKIRLSLVDEDEQVFLVEGQPVMIEGELETGRPPGMTAGTPIDAALAPAFGGLDLPAGRYAFKCEIDNKEEARVAFDVIREG